ncbi:hydroxymethylbilane synthase [soil metagenome]
MSSPVRIGTRASMLARAQSSLVADTFAAATGRAIELVEISTRGDVDRAPLSSIGGTGVFTSALRSALLADWIDSAVHSLKDRPTAAADGLCLAAVPHREDPRDALVASAGRTLGELAVGSTVGTGSPRRAAQLSALGLGLEIVDLRGNVDSRLGKVHDGLLDAVVLARAGLARLGRLDEITEVLDPLQMLPAPGQGALGVECRAGDPLADELRAVLDDPATRTAVTAERAFLGAVEAGCSAPLGALAEQVSVDPDGGDETDELWLRGVIVEPSGHPVIRLSTTGSPLEPEQVGHKLATEMLAEGAAPLLAGRTESEP